MKLDRRVAGNLDVRSIGLGSALVGVIVALLIFGVGPTALALGLAALLVVD